MEASARRLHELGFRSVLVKGGHLDAATCDDLFFDGRTARVFSGKRIATRNTHGTGCTLSSAVAAYVARGSTLGHAIADAKLFIARALAAADRLEVGNGPGPLNQFHALW